MSRPHFFTQREKVTGKVAIWAFTESEYNIKENNKPPFFYQLRTTDPWQDNATKVIEYDVELEVPVGVDLLAKTVETLRARKEELTRRYAQESADLNEKINNLLTLSWNPDPISGNDPTVIELEPDEAYGNNTFVDRMNDSDDLGPPF